MHTADKDRERVKAINKARERRFTNPGRDPVDTIVTCEPELYGLIEGREAEGEKPICRWVPCIEVCVKIIRIDGFQSLATNCPLFFNIHKAHLLTRFKGGLKDHLTTFRAVDNGDGTVNDSRLSSTEIIIHEEFIWNSFQRYR